MTAVDRLRTKNALPELADLIEQDVAIDLFPPEMGTCATRSLILRYSLIFE
ncbi:MAG: hypothetical protein KDA85_12375 [Planctomycetaceae bacterium]|nr:hypothetical protein [Planctomycetaceae bacterium]